MADSKQTRLRHGFSKEVVAKGREILAFDVKTKGSNTAFHEFMDFVRGLGVTYKVVIHPRLLLVHPDNRNGLMMNARDVHKKAATMLKAGMQTPEGTLAVELCPVDGDPLRQRHIDANKSLVERSEPYLAPVNGSERYSTMATGHCGQFGKAVHAARPTPEAILQDDSGCLSAPPAGAQGCANAAVS